MVKINEKEVFQGDIFEKTKLSAKELLVLLGKLETQLKGMGKDIQASMRNIKFDKPGDISKFNEQREKSKKVITELTALEKERIKVEKQLKDTLAKNLQAEERNFKILQKGKALLNERTAGVKSLVRLQRAEKGSVEQLNAVNAILQKRLKGVNQSTEEGVIKAARLRGAIDKNNAKVAKYADTLTALEKERIKVDKQLEVNAVKNLQANEKNYKSLQKGKAALKEKTASTKELVRIQRAERGSIEQLNAANAILRKRLRGVNQTTEEGAIKARRLRSAIDKNDAKVNQLSDSLTRQKRNIGNYAGSIKSLAIQFAGAVGLTAGIAGTVRALRSVISIFSDFQATMAKVRAISGANAQEFIKLKASAKELGETTRFTASEVAQLQVNLSKLGFDPEEINNSTAAILSLSLATGEDLAESATTVAATLRGFNLDATEAGRVADVMALSFNSSALDLNKFQTAMSKVAPVANAMGFSLEEATTLIAKLSDAGFDASTAATSTRNILLKLADANGELAQKLGSPVKTLPELVKGLKTLDAQGISLSESLEMTDKRSVAAFRTFLQGADSLIELSDKLDKAAGSAHEMGAIMEDTLEADTNKARSAIQGLVISIGERLEPILRKIVRGFAAFVNIVNDNKDAILPIIKIIGRVVGALVAYRVAVTAARIATTLFTKSIKLNPIGLLIAGITTVVGLILEYSDALFGVNKEQEKLEKGITDLERKTKYYNDELSKEAGNLNTIFDELKKTNPETEERRKAIEKLNKLYPDFNNNQLTEKTTLAEINKLQIQYLAAIKTRIAVKHQESEIQQQQEKLFRGELDIQKQLRDAGISQLKINKIISSSFKELIDIRGDYLDKNKGAVADILEDLNDLRNETEVEILNIKELYESFLQDITLIPELTEEDKETIAASLNFLEKLRGDLKLLQEQREDLSNQARDGNKISEEDIRLKNAEINAIETQINQLEILLGIRKENIEAVEDEAVVLGKAAGKAKDIAEKMKAGVEAQKEAQRELTEGVIQSTGIIIDELNKQSQARIDAFDEEIQQREDRQDQFRELAKEGIENSKENLAFEQRLEAEARLKKEKELQKQKRLELGLAAIQTFGKLSESGDGRALGKTITQITGLLAFVNSMKLADGAIDIKGAGTETSDSIPAYLSRGESVMTARETRENKAALWSIRNGNFDQQYIKMVDMPSIAPSVSNESKTYYELISEIQGLRKDMNSKETFDSIKFDKMENALKVKFVKNNTIKENIYKQGIW